MSVKSKAERQRNKVYHLKVKSILLDDVFPLLYENGWIKTPFKSDVFGTSSHGMAWSVYKFDDTECQSLSIYLTRHWSGYDRDATLQIEYRVAKLPEFDGNLWDHCDASPTFHHPEHLTIEHRFRPLGLYFDRRYGVRVSRFEKLTDRRVVRCRRELIAAFQDMGRYRSEWDAKFETPVLRLEDGQINNTPETQHRS